MPRTMRTSFLMTTYFSALSALAPFAHADVTVAVRRVPLGDAHRFVEDDARLVDAA